jgi:thiosulfate/3-mercaptopyruvate sulfurtransferase
MAYTTLISAEELAALTQRQSAQPLVIFDCSFDLAQPDAGMAQYLAQHIPGAIYASLDTALSSHGAETASGGRHPLPTPAAFAAWLTSVGMTQDAQAVVYDRNGANYCGRLWWMLNWIGHSAVAVLDGGLQAWTALGAPVAAGSDTRRTHNSAAGPESPATAFAIKPSPYRLVGAEEVLQALGRTGQTVIDARGAPRFRGEVEPLDPVAGHIPGALNRPFTANLGPDGKFKNPADLRAEFNALLAGKDPCRVVHQCGSGVSALPNLLAMTLAGFGPTALYAGSWSDWCSHPDYPMAAG